MMAFGSKLSLPKIVLHVILIAMSILFIVPLWSIVSISLSNELDIANFGYHLIPKNWDFQAYQYILKSPKTILDAYKVTIIMSAVGTLLSVLMISMCAYALSRSDFKYRRITTFICSSRCYSAAGSFPITS